MYNAGMKRPGSKVYIPVNTFDSNDPSASVTATNWLNTDCHIHKDGGTTQRASSAGETLTLNFDSITGNHLLEIDTADNTTANFYEAGSTYKVRIEGVAVDGATINAWIGVFEIGYPNAILNTTIATLASQTSFTLEEGSADNDAYSGCLVIIHDLASAVQIAQGVISDYTGASKTVTLGQDPGIFTMAAGDNVSIMPAHALAVWDRVLNGTTHNIASSAGRRVRAIQEFQGYDQGAIWVDTVNGTAGTTDFENGTVENPVDSIADANTLAASLGITRFRIAPGSSITFAAAQEGQEFIGSAWTLALGGQSIANSYFEGATVSGTGTGTGHHFVHCAIGAVSVSDGSMGWCRFTGTITLTGANDSYWHDCYSGVAGAGTPVVDFGAAVANTNLNMRRYSGGIQINNKDATGTDQMSIEGNGQLIVAASSGGAISVRGNFKVTNTGGATITYDDNTQNVADILTDTGTTLPATLGTPTDLGGGATLADNNADIAGATFNTATDSNEAIRNHIGDGTNLTEAGGDGDHLTQVALAADFRVKKNTALNNFEFLMVDATDFATPETGLTVSGERSIDGAAFAATANSVTEVANGIYKINLAASDLNGDVITFRFTAAGAADTFITIVTQTE